MDIRFACQVCGAVLKVKAALSGKILQCPRCGKRTKVVPIDEASAAAPSAGSATQTAASAPAASTQPQIPPATTQPKPTPPSPHQQQHPAVTALPRPPIDVPKPSQAAPEAPFPPVAEQPGAQVAASNAAFMKEMEEKLRKLEAELEVARLKTEKAEQEKEAILARLADEREKMREEAAAHYTAEMEAAKKTIAQLQLQIEEEKRRRVESLKSSRSAAEIERDLLKIGQYAITESEMATADALIADIKASTMGRYFRLSVIIHAAVIILTSIFFIISLIRGRSVSPTEPLPAPAQSAPAPSALPAASTSAKAETRTEHEAEKSPAPVPTTSSETGRREPKTDLEKKVESLPSREELPKDTSVTLDLDR